MIRRCQCAYSSRRGKACVCLRPVRKRPGSYIYRRDEEICGPCRSRHHELEESVHLPIAPYPPCFPDGTEMYDAKIKGGFMFPFDERLGAYP